MKNPAEKPEPTISPSDFSSFMAEQEAKRSKDVLLAQIQDAEQARRQELEDIESQRKVSRKRLIFQRIDEENKRQEELSNLTQHRDAVISKPSLSISDMPDSMRMLYGVASRAGVMQSIFGSRVLKDLMGAEMEAELEAAKNTVACSPAKRERTYSEKEMARYKDTFIKAHEAEVSKLRVCATCSDFGRNLSGNMICLRSNITIATPEATMSCWVRETED